jgi:hypothetical protein
MLIVDVICVVTAILLLRGFFKWIKTKISVKRRYQDHENQNEIILQYKI